MKRNQLISKNFPGLLDNKKQNLIYLDIKISGMAETSFSKAEEFTGQIKEYINNRIDSIKLDLAEKTSKILASLIAGMAVAIFIFMFFLFVNIALAYFLGALMDNIWLGFLIVSGLYLLIGIIIWIARIKLLTIPIMNRIIEIIFKPESDNETN